MRQLFPNGKACEALAPAERVTRLFGEQKAAEIAGVSIDAVRKWRRRKATGGAGGLVPSQYQPLFLRAAERLGLALSAADLIAEPY